MKKTYITPEACSINLEAAEVLLAGSILSGGGHDYTEIAPGEGEYDGEFQSQKRGWNSDLWNN